MTPATGTGLRLGVPRRLRPADLRALALTGMNPAETTDYITHHLKIAGRDDTLFSADATTA
jgi:type II secretory pathway predicted ATPase ExeA